MIQPLLEARAKKCTKFHWFFGVWENLVFCFRDLLTFRPISNFSIEIGDQSLAQKIFRYTDSFPLRFIQSNSNSYSTSIHKQQNVCIRLIPLLSRWGFSYIHQLEIRSIFFSMIEFGTRAYIFVYFSFNLNNGITTALLMSLNLKFKDVNKVVKILLFKLKETLEESIQYYGSKILQHLDS